jgi:hypothetical protein
VIPVSGTRTVKWGSSFFPNKLNSMERNFYREAKNALAVREISSCFEETECSLPSIQQSTTSIYPNANGSFPRPNIVFLFYAFFIFSSNLRLGLSNGLFHSDFPTKSLYAFLFLNTYATCTERLILVYLIISIIRICERRETTKLPNMQFPSLILLSSS